MRMKPLLAGLLRVEGAVAVAAYSVTCLLLLADVFSREIASQAIWGAQQLAIFGAIIAGVLGLTMAVGNNAHLRASFADKILPWPWVGRFADLVSAMIFAAFCYYAVIFVAQTIQYDDRAEVIFTPLWPVQAVFPYAFGTAALRHFLFFLIPDLKPSAEGASAIRVNIESSIGASSAAAKKTGGR